jgi:hypothetical protein
MRSKPLIQVVSSQFQSKLPDSLSINLEMFLQKSGLDQLIGVYFLELVGNKQIRRNTQIKTAS